MTITHLLDCLGGTVLHALWQGLAIGILVLAALRSTPNLTARSRHAISSLGLIAFFVVDTLPFTRARKRLNARAAAALHAGCFL